MTGASVQSAAGAQPRRWSAPVRISNEGEEEALELDSAAQAALYFEVVLRGQAGLVELCEAERRRDGRLVFKGARKRAADWIVLAGGEEATRAYRERCVALSESGAEVFVSPAARVRLEPTNDAVEEGRCCWVDVDGVASAGEISWVDVLRPHLLIGSGGGVHAYWRLERAVSGERLESLNRRLCEAVGGDPQSCNRGRVMRLPGSSNSKVDRHCQIVAADLDRVEVSVERLEAALADPKERRPERRRVPRRLAIPEDEELRTLCPREYVWALCGVEVPRSGYIRCPLPDHEERTASFRVFESAQKGFWCFGCGRGGTVFDLASALRGGPTGRGLRGEAFKEARQGALEALGLAADG